MRHITIVTPAKAGTRTGNRHTALRWAAMLRAPATRVSVMVDWDGTPCDLLIALHARRSCESVFRYEKQNPGRPIVVVLTGTDLYRDLPGSAEARRSLALADRVIVLQEDALRVVDRKIRSRTRVVYQSSDATLRQRPPAGEFRVAVVGHLREEKDPLRAAAALRLLPEGIHVLQVGDPLDPAFGVKARQIMKQDSRYRWVGGCSHRRALGWIARSHLLVVSSVMEGGANVICEAARIGTPVLASRVSGNVGMLGRKYPGYYELFNEAELAGLISKARGKNFYRKLKSALHARRSLFAPAAEKRALRAVLADLL